MSHKLPLNCGLSVGRHERAYDSANLLAASQRIKIAGPVCARQYFRVTALTYGTSIRNIRLARLDLSLELPDYEVVQVYISSQSHR
jgi:hypothetical protein